MQAERHRGGAERPLHLGMGGQAWFAGEGRRLGLGHVAAHVENAHMLHQELRVCRLQRQAAFHVAPRLRYVPGVQRQHAGGKPAGRERRVGAEQPADHGLCGARIAARHGGEGLPVQLVRWRRSRGRRGQDGCSIRARRTGAKTRLSAAMARAAPPAMAAIIVKKLALLITSQ